MPRDHKFRGLGAATAVVMLMVALAGPMLHVWVGTAPDATNDVASAGAVVQSDIDGHGHSHDDGWPEAPASEHSHHHNPADHSHDVPAIVVFDGDAALDDHTDTLIAARFSWSGGLSARLERPPRV